MLHHHPITLLEKKLVAENTTEMTFLISLPGFTFKSGQYISIEVPSHEDIAIPDRYHDFSIVSSPSKPENISIVFRNSESIFKKAILKLPIGGEVYIDGPKGVITLPESPKPLVFIAGGVGISPLLSMVRYAIETHLSISIMLLYCNTREETAPYRDELALLEKQNPSFKYQEAWGVPQPELFVPITKEFSEAEWYIVGAPAMVENVEKMILDLGVNETNIRIEEFSGY